MATSAIVILSGVVLSYHQERGIMADQAPAPKEKVEVFWFCQQPNSYVSEQDLEKYESGRLGFPNTHFDPQKAAALYNQYHEQYAWADEVGYDGIMTNEHHASYFNLKPSVNLDAAVISKVTKRVRIAILGSPIAINDPIKMAEEVAMLDCYSGGRIIAGFIRGTPVESLQAGIDPSENRGRFEEAHDLILKCWTTPGPFRWEGRYFHYRMVNPWVLPMQKPHPEIWFPGLSSPESVVWAAKHRHPYMNQGARLDTTEWLRNIYIDTANEVGFQPGPQHFGYTIKVLVADTDAKAQEIGRTFMWTGPHRHKGPREHVDPPGYQTREAVKIQRNRPSGGLGGQTASYEELQEINSIVVGSPDTVIQKLTEVINRLNPGYLHAWGAEGDMTQQDVMRSIELMGREVIPALHKIKLQPYQQAPLP